MDLSTILLEKLFGFTPRKVVRIFILRMWVGYAFDAGAFAFLWIYVGINWKSDTWKYVFYGYCGFIGLMAILITFLTIFCILRGDDSTNRINRYKKIPYLMGYFKLTSAVNAGMVFFMLYFYANDRSEAAVLVILILTGIDMGINLIQMAFGVAGLNLHRLMNKSSKAVEDGIPNKGSPRDDPFRQSKPKKKRSSRK